MNLYGIVLLWHDQRFQQTIFYLVVIGDKHSKGLDSDGSEQEKEAYHVNLKKEDSLDRVTVTLPTTHLPDPSFKTPFWMSFFFVTGICCGI